MLCDSCKERDAVVQVTQVTDPPVRQLNLCEKCAAERGIETHVTMPKQPLADVIQAVYVDSDGYGARYTATTSGAGEVVFVSDAVAKLPRYRLTYTQLPDGRMNAKLEVAPAGKPKAFANYLEWVSKRVTTKSDTTTPTPAAKP